MICFNHGCAKILKQLILSLLILKIRVSNPTEREVKSEIEERKQREKKYKLIHLNPFLTIITQNTALLTMKNV